MRGQEKKSKWRDIFKKRQNSACFFLHAVVFYISSLIYRAYRGVAQFGRALRSGRRGRKFESCRLDSIRACWSSGQDDALSRRKPGFDSRTGHFTDFMKIPPQAVFYCPDSPGSFHFLLFFLCRLCLLCLFAASSVFIRKASASQQPPFFSRSLSGPVGPVSLIPVYHRILSYASFALP